MKISRGDKTLDFNLIRKPVIFPAVEVLGAISSDKSIHYLKFQHFKNDNVCFIIEKAVIEAEKQHAKGFVIDLRGNGGGLMDVGACIASLFLPKDKLLITLKAIAGNKAEQKLAPNGISSKIKLVILVDAGSASASEVFAGEMQDYGRAWIIGERTFGKASVQRMDSEPPVSGTNFAKTAWRIFLPSGRTYQGVGILPDFEAYPSLNPTEEDKFSLREADLYPNALAPMDKDWINPRLREITKIKLCTAKSTVHNEDYPLKMAIDVLNCETNNF